VLHSATPPFQNFFGPEHFLIAVLSREKVFGKETLLFFQPMNRVYG
jgi:hypothetical protein